MGATSPEGKPVSDTDRAEAMQLAEIERRTGKSLVQLGTLLHGSGLAAPDDLVEMLKHDLALPHDDAVLLVDHLLGKAALDEGEVGPS
jgi:cyanate lyase